MGFIHAEDSFRGVADVCLKQEASIACLIFMLCLDGSVTLFTLGGVDLLVSKKFKMDKVRAPHWHYLGGD